MAFSDDEGDDAVAQYVTNYHFVDDKDEPISFCVLPIQWNDGVTSSDSMQKQIFLHGISDNGLQKIYKQVTTWKYDLSNVQPELWVLSKENNWIKLQKPRKSFETMIRTILITISCLHFLKKNPETLDKSLWDHLRKVFSSYEVKPSENDLLDHLSLISDAVKHDPELSRSKFLLTFLENPMKSKSVIEDTNIVSDPKKSKFIVEDDEISDEEVGVTDEDDSDEETDLFDSVCSICDNGGELLCCEGRCLRSFHATIDAGAESECKSLGLSKAQVKAIQNFLCKNCQYKRHQCFACGKLGSSDKSSGAEVFSCASATCGYFYHPECVSKLLHPGNEAEAEEFQKKISAGESFTCPAHKCSVCKQGENKDVPELQFSVCRRCPKAYHRKCLPRKIAFKENEDEDIKTRAWEGLLPNNRVLIYCLKHKIDEDLGTPIRNHIIFPHLEEKKKKRSPDLQSGNSNDVLKKRSGFFGDSSSEKTTVKKPKQVEGVPFHGKDSTPTLKVKNHNIGQGFDSTEKSKVTDASRKPVKDSSKPASMKTDMRSITDESKVFTGEEKLKPKLKKGSEPVKIYQQDVSSNNLEKNKTSAPLVKRPISRPSIDAEAKKRILTLMQKISSSITLAEVTKSHKLPSTHAYSSKYVVDKTITQGKVEHFVEVVRLIPVDFNKIPPAVRSALRTLEEGYSIEDAKAVCGPQILNQINKWKNKLKVYLAPFLHGMRYTSFGRHFTKVDKLKEIVDKLHWYIQNGDTIVDFCCGANDFSCIMKEKLEETGKRCSFKNYDVIQPKNDFNFEKRDWMTVGPKELPTGSKLIMGLNPPFGVKAALANKFINKALEFKPKLLILIVPQETERLDKKDVAYELVWEDNEKLSGKSFYLPGSVDVKDKQMDQWNLKPPLLYLWSRPDWSAKHKDIALKQGHKLTGRESHVEEYHIKESRVEEYYAEAEFQNHIAEEFRNQIQPEFKNYTEIEFENRTDVVIETQINTLSDMEVSPVHNYYGDNISKLIKDYGGVSNQINDLPGHNNDAKVGELAAVSKGQKGRSPLKHDAKVSQQRMLVCDEGESHMHHGSSRKRSLQNQERQGKGKQTRMSPAAAPGSRMEFASTQDGNIHKETPSRVSSPFGMTETTSLLQGHPSAALQTPSERARSEEGTRPFQRDLTGSGLEYGTGYGGLQTSTHDEDLVDIARRYSLNERDPFASGADRWSTGSSLVREFGMQSSGEQFPGFMRDNADNFGRTPYPSKLDERTRRESDIRMKLQLYGRQDADSSGSGSFPPNQDTGFRNMGSTLSSTPYGLPGSSIEPTYNRTTSTMQRYAPRLDELNHTRAGGYISETPPLVGRSGMYGNPGSQYAPGPRPGFHPDSFGFAPAPPRPFSQQGSSGGWLNDD